MNGYSNFSLASYMFAYYAARVTDEELRQGMETYLWNVPLKKVYVEKRPSMKLSWTIISSPPADAKCAFRRRERKAGRISVRSR